LTHCHLPWLWLRLYGKRGTLKLATGQQSSLEKKDNCLKTSPSYRVGIADAQRSFAAQRMLSELGADSGAILVMFYDS
jgi:hypothetical protein